MRKSIFAAAVLAALAWTLSSADSAKAQYYWTWTTPTYSYQTASFPPYNYTFMYSNPYAYTPYSGGWSMPYSSNFYYPNYAYGYPSYWYPRYYGWRWNRW